MLSRLVIALCVLTMVTNQGESAMEQSETRLNIVSNIKGSVSIIIEAYADIWRMATANSMSVAAKIYRLVLDETVVHTKVAINMCLDGETGMFNYPVLRSTADELVLIWKIWEEGEESAEDEASEANEVKINDCLLEDENVHEDSSFPAFRAVDKVVVLDFSGQENINIYIIQAVELDKMPGGKFETLQFVTVQDPMTGVKYPLPFDMPAIETIFPIVCTTLTCALMLITNEKVIYQPRSVRSGRARFRRRRKRRYY